MAERDVTSDLIRGHIDAIVLNALVPADTYGYQVLKHVAVASGGAYELKEPSLYTCLKRLEQNGWVTSYWGDETQGARRKYYHLTSEGAAELKAATERWASVKTVIDRLLGQASAQEEATHDQ